MDIIKWRCYKCIYSRRIQDELFCRFLNEKLEKDSYCPEYTPRSINLSYKDFKGSSIYLTRKEKYLVHEIMKKQDIEEINNIYWDDYRNILEKLKPEE